ncbi:MAG: hypothetical protein HYW03_09275 [Deltaproteobacteria bacterium]|nr:hypothetical protein [Deltaproteobacteria bacterium]
MPVTNRWFANALGSRQIGAAIGIGIASRAGTVAGMSTYTIGIRHTGSIASTIAGTGHGLDLKSKKSVNNVRRRRLE